MPQTLQPQTAQTPQGMDGSVISLAKAIRQTESGGDFNAQGKSGESGAYQWTPQTWQSHADQVLGDSKAPMTPSNQNAVAYGMIKTWKDSGLNPAQIAAKWNSGSETGWENKIGVNSQGVKYNVPAYVKSVTDAYQTLKQGGQVGMDPNNPSSAAGTQTDEGGGIMSTLGKIANVGLPIAGGILGGIAGAAAGAPAFGIGALGGGAAGAGIGAAGGTALANLFNQTFNNSQITPLQAAGEPLLMGAATAASGGANEALGGLKGLGGLAARTGAQAGIGAGFGAGNALVQGQPGDIGKQAAIGAAFGGVANMGGEALSKLIGNTAARTGESRLQEQTDRLKTLQSAFEKNSSATTNPIQTLEENSLTSLLRVEDGKINATNLTNPTYTGTIDNMIEDHASQASQLVKGMQGGVPLESMKQEALAAVASNPVIRDAGKVPQAAAEIERRFASFQQSFGETIPYKAVDNIRVAMNREFDPSMRDVARTIGDTARAQLYNGNGANTALKSAMTNESELIKARNFLEKLHGTTVKGGRLGKYFADLLGGTVGAIAGSTLGPFSAVAGGAIGAAAGDRTLNAVQSSYFNPIGSQSAGALQNFLKAPGVRGGVQATKVGLLQTLLNASSNTRQ